MENELLTVEQLAELLQVSARTIWRMRSEGHVPTPVRIRGGIRWRATDVREWIARGCPVQHANGEKFRR